jgi:hypothetical protein
MLSWLNCKEFCACGLYMTVPYILSLTLRKEHRLRVFENRVLRRIFGPKWDEVINKRLEKTA